jgi:hypothetical protein
MSTWTLADIRQKVRKVTGRLTPGELSNDDLDDYINKYYTLTFPAELKLERKHTYYEFLTVANTAWYDLPNTTYTNFEPPAKIDEYDLLWFQEPASFAQNNLLQVTRLTPWTGDGSTVTFTTTASSFPILPDTLVITDNIETFEDTSQTWTTDNVVITGDLGGVATINYSTGSISVTFNTAPPNGDSIFLSYEQFKAGRPESVLLYNNQFQFFPVPDTAYRFKVKSYSIVSELTNATDTPDLNQWGPCISYGAARDILADLGEMDAYVEVTALYKEQLAYVLKRTNQNLLNTRAPPNF